MQPCVYRTQPQLCFEGESNEAISGGRANPWLGAMSLTWEMIQWHSDPLVCAFFTHTHTENWSKQKKHTVDFSHSWWVHRQAGDGRFLCRLIRVDCSTTACICQTRVKWNLQNFRDLGQPSPNIILLIRKSGSELPTASALIYLMHDSMRMPRPPSLTKQLELSRASTVNKGCHCASPTNWHRSALVGIVSLADSKPLLMPQECLRPCSAWLTATWSRSRPPAFTCTAADSAPRLTPPLFQQEGRAMKTLRATGAFNKQLQCRRDSTSSWDWYTFGFFFLFLFFSPHG